MTSRSWLLLTVAVLSASPVAAQVLRPSDAITGPYVAGGAGLNLLQDPSLSPEGNTATQLRGIGINPSGSLTFNPGFAGVLSLGWGFGNGLRAEVEGNFRRNDADGASGFAGAGRLGVSGQQDSYGIMGNVLLDLGSFGPVVPYVGAGLGYVVTDWRQLRLSGNATDVRLTATGSDGRFAFQGIAGLAFPLDFLPGAAVTAEYRFLGTQNPSIPIRAESRTTGATIASGRVETETYNHSLLVGIRYAFNPAPPAPAAAAPAPAPSTVRTFLVFFDYDRADLTERARQIVAEASLNARRAGGETRLEVSGHTDRAGTPAYNQGLSQRRADAVAAELVRNGVARGDILVTAFGETRPLVATADGVREPQNRRVEILLR
ncbi:OmpA family protein [Plastoroseomonas arctica]|uniref:OmpA family protein n=1 Tax=Plastoroseomonas arctica TaxID=1509237 RepID=UPI001FE6A7E6|nr:OmpA family protein [Plastoroseomonas arctica]